jgi:putative ABC transport system substrate-binding protein
MRRRKFITLLGGAAAAWPLAARAQEPERVRRISVVNVIAATDPEASPRIAAFEMALRKLGWVIERDLRIYYYWSAGDVARTRDMAKQVVATRPDLIVTVTTPPTQALRDETGDIPIVFLQVFDPVSTGLVASLARPGGNITGFTNFESSMAGKWLQLLKEIAPHIRRVAVLFNPTTTPGSALYLDSIEAASPSFAVKPAAALVRSVEDISDALSELAREPDAGLIVAPDTFTTNNRDLITSLAALHRVPAVYPFRYFATAGGLLSYGIDSTDLFPRSASYVDLILKGTKPADPPVQQPTKFELVINLKTARALGLKIPPTLLALADEVIE